MAVATPTSYAGSGTIRGGRVLPPVALPAWRTAITPGKFADISLNTLATANDRPVGWPTNEAAGPFANWSGRVRLEDFGALGGYGTQGSGHLQTGQPLWAGNWIFDVATREWGGANVPNAVMPEPPYSPGPPPTLDYIEVQYYQSTDPSTLNHLYPGHSYGGLLEQPASEGGGQKGSLVRAFVGGGIAKNAVYKYDVADPHAPPARVVDTVPFWSESAGTYPMTARDTARAGFWVAGNNGHGPLTFVKFSDWSQLPYPDVGFNISGGHNLVYVPAPYDCLVAFGPGLSNFAMEVRVSKILAGIPQPWVLVTQAGTPPVGQAECSMGGDWCPPLACIVGYEGGHGTAVSHQVHKLIPPAPANATSGVWTWTPQAVVGMTGQDPSNQGMNPNSGFPMQNNGSWGSFKYFASVNCFIWCNGVSAPVQAFVLQGM